MSWSFTHSCPVNTRDEIHPKTFILRDKEPAQRALWHFQGWRGDRLFLWVIFTMMLHPSISWERIKSNKCCVGKKQRAAWRVHGACWWKREKERETCHRCTSWIRHEDGCHLSRSEAKEYDRLSIPVVTGCLSTCIRGYIGLLLIFLT